MTTSTSSFAYQSTLAKMSVPAVRTTVSPQMIRVYDGDVPQIKYSSTTTKPMVQDKPQPASPSMITSSSSSLSSDMKPTESAYNLPPSAETWCSPPSLPSIDFQRCNQEGTINAVPMFGGLTNLLKFALLGALYSMERNECFFLDETNSDLHNREDKSQEFDSFLAHFFEPMGLPVNSTIVQQARAENRIKHLDAVKDLFSNPHVKRMFKDSTTISSLGFSELDGHSTKKVMMKRLWRPLPGVRNHTCSTLDSVYGLHEDYMAFSIRRGDKEEIENKKFADLDQYISEAENMIPERFNGVVPKIFIATDDCTVLSAFRKRRPYWTFLSECDGQERKAPSGFALKDVKSWSKEDTDDHFRKFFIELYALAFSKVYIGVSTTNVAWWAYFMRSEERSNFRLVNLGEEITMKRLDFW